MNKRKHAASKSKWPALARADGTFNFQALSAKQKEKFFQECQAIAGDEAGSALTPAQPRLQACASAGRPRKGRGAQIISLSIEKNLLRRAERLAKAQGLSRSELYRRGLRIVLAMAGAA